MEIGKKGWRGNYDFRIFLLLSFLKQSWEHGNMWYEFCFPRGRRQGGEECPAGPVQDVIVPPAVSHFANSFLSKGFHVAPWEVITGALSPGTVSSGWLWLPGLWAWVAHAGQWGRGSLWAQEEKRCMSPTPVGDTAATLLVKRFIMACVNLPKKYKHRKDIRKSPPAVITNNMQS